MKKLFLIMGIAGFTFAAAQDNGVPRIKVIPPKPKNNISTTPKTYLVTPPAQLLADAKLLNTLPNGNKVYALPQDNMPCVVPGMSQFNMPTVKPDIPEYTIPNPAYPPPANKSITLTEEQLKQLLEKVKMK